MTSSKSLKFSFPGKDQASHKNAEKNENTNFE